MLLTSKVESSGTNQKLHLEGVKDSVAAKWTSTFNLSILTPGKQHDDWLRQLHVCRNSLVPVLSSFESFRF